MRMGLSIGKRESCSRFWGMKNGRMQRKLSQGPLDSINAGVR